MFASVVSCRDSAFASGAAVISSCRGDRLAELLTQWIPLAKNPGPIKPHPVPLPFHHRRLTSHIQMFLKTRKIVNPQQRLVNHTLAFLRHPEGNTHHIKLRIHDTKHFTKGVIFTKELTNLHLMHFVRAPM